VSLITNSDPFIGLRHQLSNFSLDSSGEVVRFADPNGMLIELIKSTPGGAVVPWTENPVPA